MVLTLDVNTIADRFAALSSATRIEIVRHLLAAHNLGGLTVGVVQNELGIAASTLNHHLGRLRRAGILECRREGQRIWCAVRLAALEEMQLFLYDQCCSRGEATQGNQHEHAITNQGCC